MKEGNNIIKEIYLRKTISKTDLITLKVLDKIILIYITIIGTINYQRKTIKVIIIIQDKRTSRNKSQLTITIVIKT